MSKAEPAPPSSMEMELLNSPGLVLHCQYFSGMGCLLVFWRQRMTCNVLGFPGLSFHLPVFSLQPPVLLMPDFIIFAISNRLFGPCQSLISAGGKREKVRLSLVKLI